MGEPKDETVSVKAGGIVITSTGITGYLDSLRIAVEGKDVPLDRLTGATLEYRVGDLPTLTLRYLAH